MRFWASPPIATSFGIKSVEALNTVVRQFSNVFEIEELRFSSPQYARVPQFFEFENRLIAFDNLRSNARLTESCRTLRQAHETVELCDGANDRHPGSIVFIEFAKELRQG